MRYGFQRDKIKALRRTHRLTQHEMAKKIGRARQHICAYEKGVSMPSVKTLVKLLNVFELPADYFFVREYSSENNNSSRL